jgi:hypothetical protein
LPAPKTALTLLLQGYLKTLLFSVIIYSRKKLVVFNPIDTILGHYIDDIILMMPMSMKNKAS